MSIVEIKNSLEVVDTTSLVDRVEKQLIELFISNKVKMGDSIPKEVELAEVLGVSRTVIREALLRLRMIGLIDSKKKRGAILTNPDLLALLKKTMYPTILSDRTLKDIFEMRLVLEVGMADFIFAKITDEDIKELEEIVSKEPDHLDTSLFEIEHEVNFHGKLYEITGNETLKGFQKMLLSVFDYVHLSGLLQESVELDNFTSHKDLVNMLKNGTPELFRNGMRNHLDNHFRRLIDKP